MSWYSSNWSHRQAIVIDNLTGAGTIDVTASLPADFDPFWDNVLVSGNDIRVTLADGKTLATYDVDAFNAVNRAGIIEVDNLTATSSDAMLVLWLYWGNPAASSATTTFTPSAPKTGYIVPDCMPRPHGQVIPSHRSAYRKRWRKNFTYGGTYAACSLAETPLSLARRCARRSTTSR